MIEEFGRFCEIAGLDPIDHANSSTPVGYWICRDAQGRSLATRALAALVQRAFEELDLSRVSLSAAIENERSSAVARRSGLAEEGVMREAERHSDRFVSLESYSILRSDRAFSPGAA